VGVVAELTPVEFRADLQQMLDTIGTVTRESGRIKTDMLNIASDFNKVKADWVGPSELSFEDVQQWFTRVQTDLQELLEETIRRLTQAYRNYHDAETGNVQNLTANVPGGHQDDHGNGGGSSGSNGNPDANNSTGQSRPAGQPVRPAGQPVRPAGQPVRPADQPLRLS
jgi:WXG100 family type VII secretion target